MFKAMLKGYGRTGIQAQAYLTLSTSQQYKGAGDVGENGLQSFVFAS